MSVQTDIKEALESRILEGLQGEAPSTQLLAVARQFLKDFPPEGPDTATGPGATGMLGQYQKRIDKLEAEGVAESA